MWGGEERTGKVKYPKGTQFFHNSDTRIEAFESKGYPESTCFFVDDRGNGTYRYVITTGFDRNISHFGSEEVRFDPRKEDEIIEISTGRKVKIID